MTKSQSKTYLNSSFFLFLGALILRVAYTLFLKNNYFFYASPSDDVLYYQDWAKEISRVDFIGTKTFFGLPLYPYFLAILDRLTLGHWGIIRFLHLLLGSFNCVLAYWLTRRIFSEKIALLAGWLMASHFVLIYYDWIMAPVTLIIFLSLVIVLALLDLLMSLRVTPQRDEAAGRALPLAMTRRWLSLGILLGLSMLADGKMLIFLGLLVFYLIGRSKNILDRMTLLLPLLLGIFLILGTTGLRNKLVGGDWVFITAQSGFSFYAGNNAKTTGVFENPDFIRPTHQGQDEDLVIMAENLSGKKLSPARVSQFWFKRALAFIQTHPGDYLKLLSRKLILFFTETERAFDMDLLFQRGWKKILDFNPFFLLCPLAVLGIFLGRKESRPTIFLNLVILSQLIFTLIFFLNNRQRAAILPFLIIFESAAIGWIVQRVKVKDFKKLIPAFLYLGLFFILFRPQSLDAQEFQFLKFAKAGPVYEKKGEYKTAESMYRQALKVHPEDTNSLYNLGNLFFLEGSFKEAGEYYKKVLFLNPRQVDAMFNLGFTYENLGDSFKAKAMYEEVLTLQESSPDAHFRLAKIYEQENDCPKAQAHYVRLIQLRPILKEKILKLMRCR